jgi:uncharacterized iron-regulated protein
MNPMKVSVFIGLIFAALLMPAGGGQAFAQDGLLTLRIGDPARRDSTLAVATDTIVDTARGEPIAPHELTERLGAARLILVAEQHTGIEFHRVQLRVIQMLQHSGQNLMLGLEMFPPESQSVLDRWTAGELSEAEFIAESEWYDLWGYHWGYYRDIFLYARAHGIRLAGINPASRPLSAATDSAPAIGADLSSADHRTLLRAFFEDDSPIHGSLSDEQAENLFVAQCERDAAMAYYAAETLSANPQHRLVVLAGTGHVLYGLGIARQINAWYDGKVATITPVAIDDGEIQVRASIADFVWGVPELEHPEFPELGVVSMQSDNRLRIIYVEPDSPAAQAGIRANDILLELGAGMISGRRDLRQAVANLQWGDQTSAVIERSGERRRLVVTFRR